MATFQRKLNHNMNLHKNKKLKVFLLSQQSVPWVKYIVFIAVICVTVVVFVLKVRSFSLAVL